MPDVAKGVEQEVLVHLLVPEEGEEGQVGWQVVSMLVTVPGQHVNGCLQTWLRN